MYTINPKANAKITKQNIMANNPRNEMKQNHKISSLIPKGDRKRGKGGKEQME